MGTPVIFIIPILWVFNFSSVSHAGSTIYKHVDKDGNITFTNRPIKGAQKIQTPARPSKTKAPSAETIRYFPKESNITQKNRDIKRREILEHELATEMKLFSDTRKNLSAIHGDHENRQQKETIRQLQSKLLRHENNITALKKELTKL